MCLVYNTYCWKCIKCIAFIDKTTDKKDSASFIEAKANITTYHRNGILKLRSRSFLNIYVYIKKK